VNLVDSCGWLEYLAEGPNASFFAEPLEDVESLIVPSICILEVVKKILQQRSQAEALQVATTMQQGKVISLGADLALDAAALGLRHGLPLADAVILATAQASDAVIWTQDSDFENLDGVKYVARR
jgi:predicted nucleic acid-binding protein